MQHADSQHLVHVALPQEAPQPAELIVPALLRHLVVHHACGKRGNERAAEDHADREEDNVEHPLDRVQRVHLNCTKGELGETPVQGGHVLEVAIHVHEVDHIAPCVDLPLRPSKPGVAGAVPPQREPCAPTEVVHPDYPADEEQTLEEDEVGVRESVLHPRLDHPAHLQEAQQACNPEQLAHPRKANDPENIGSGVAIIDVQDHAEPIARSHQDVWHKVAAGKVLGDLVTTHFHGLPVLHASDEAHENVKGPKAAGDQCQRPEASRDGDVPGQCEGDHREVVQEHHHVAEAVRHCREGVWVDQDIDPRRGGRGGSGSQLPRRVAVAPLPCVLPRERSTGGERAVMVLNHGCPDLN
mmetsp:Transcript_36942/g.110330  ORF Transcript_36942/g.110330 Transcript_36942/m.110330 type:complete len:355 (-) Transcript_36942:129-1193(-)